MEIAAEAEKASAFNSILLSFFAVAIPGVFGSAATYLIGRGTMEAGATALAEGLYFMKSLTGVIAKGATSIAKNAGSIGAAAGSGINYMKNYVQDRQFTRDYYKYSTLGDFAKSFGIKMRRSKPEIINRTLTNGDGYIQSKDDGITSVYDRFGSFRGIIRKDGSFVDTNSLSVEERKKYAPFDRERSFGVIDTKTGNFVQARYDSNQGIVAINNGGRIGKIKNKKMLKQFNKMVH